MSDTTSDRRDARRIPLQTQLRYREIGEVDWCDGQTENVSRSGILFRGQQTGEPNSAIELVVIFPETETGPGGRALCSGHIVRASSGTDSSVSLAARISSCRVVGRVTKEIVDWAEWPAALVGEA